MKSTLTKTLLCGLIASSFILVNCQKASSRKLKPTPSPQQQQQDNANKAIDPKTTGVCTPEFMSQFEKWNTTIEEANKLRGAASKSVDEAQKQELRAMSKKVADVNQETIAAMEKIKLPIRKGETNTEEKKTTACVGKDKSGKEMTVAITFLNQHATEAMEKIGVVLGETSEELKKAREEKEKKEKPASDVESQPFYNVSKEMNEFLADKNSTQLPQYIMDGKIQDERFEETKADKSKSLCYVVKADVMLEEDDLKVNTLEVDKQANVGEKQSYQIQFGSGDNFYTLQCLIPKGSSINTEFKKIVGSHLLTDEQVAAEKKAKEETENAGKVAKPEGETQQTKDSTGSATTGTSTPAGTDKPVVSGKSVEDDKAKALKAAEEKEKKIEKELAEANDKVKKAEAAHKTANEKVTKLEEAAATAGDKDAEAEKTLNEAANGEAKEKAKVAFDKAREAYDNAINAIQDALPERRKAEADIKTAKEEVAKKEKELAEAKKETTKLATGNAAAEAADAENLAAASSVANNFQKVLEKRATK